MLRESIGHPLSCTETKIEKLMHKHPVAATWSELIELLFFYRVDFSMVSDCDAC